MPLELAFLFVEPLEGRDYLVATELGALHGGARGAVMWSPLERATPGKALAFSDLIQIVRDTVDCDQAARAIFTCAFRWTDSANCTSASAATGIKSAL
jgi:hypothetical protein